MSMSEWAKREVEIACKRERGVSTEEGEWDYGCACYESALKAYESLCEDGHSGYSIHLTKNILNRLIDGKPLTPIEDTDDEWEEVTRSYGMDDSKMTIYQCKRMTSLFKDVYKDGTVKYSDTNRVVCVERFNDNNTWYNGFVRGIIDEMYPITMPYMPTSKPIRVYCEEMLTDPKNGDFDSLSIRYLVKQDDNDPGIFRELNVNRFFKEGTESEPGWVEISFKEWCERKRMAAEREAAMAKED